MKIFLGIGIYLLRYLLNKYNIIVELVLSIEYIKNIYQNLLLSNIIIAVFYFLELISPKGPVTLLDIYILDRNF